MREYWRSATPDFDGETGHYVGMLGKLPVYQTDTGRNFVSIKGEMFQVPDSEVKKD